MMPPYHPTREKHSMIIVCYQSVKLTVAWSPLGTNRKTRTKQQLIFLTYHLFSSMPMCCLTCVVQRRLTLEGRGGPPLDNEDQCVARLGRLALDLKKLVLCALAPSTTCIINRSNKTVQLDKTGLHSLAHVQCFA